MNDKLSGGAKFGYLVLGLVLNVIGVLIAWLVNRGKPTQGDAIKFSVIGLVIDVVLWIIFYVTVITAFMSNSAAFIA